MKTTLALSLILQLQLYGFSIAPIELHAQTPLMDQSTNASEPTGQKEPTGASESQGSQSAEVLLPITIHDQKSPLNGKNKSLMVEPVKEEPEPDSNLFSSSTQIDDHFKTGTDNNAGRGQKYVGNSFSLKFHKLSCPFARVMRKSRRVSFSYRKAAVDAGQRPCKYCLPPWWLKVEAKILNHDLEAESTSEATSEPDD